MSDVKVITKTLADALSAVAHERGRQDAKWGADRNLHHLQWFAILTEENLEVAMLMNEEGAQLLIDLGPFQDGVSQS